MSVLDPFGPNFHLVCQMCCFETHDEQASLQNFIIFSCNQGKMRIALIDKILKELGAAWVEERSLPWIDAWMRIDVEKLKGASFLSAEEQKFLDSNLEVSKQLLTKRGYFNLKGLHGGCRKCVDRWIRRSSSCQMCRTGNVQQFTSTYLNQKIQTKFVGTEKPLNSDCIQSLNDQITSFIGEIKGIATFFGRFVTGGNEKTRGEYLRMAVHRLDRVVSILIKMLIHNILFHSAVKITLLAGQSFGFRGFESWLQVVDSMVEWSMSWAQHVLIWKTFVSVIDYSFRQFSVNYSYTALSHHVMRLDALAILWLAFKVIYRADFGYPS